MKESMTFEPGADGRGPHPDPALFLDLVFDLATPQRRAELLAHLAACPDCEREFRLVAAQHEHALSSRRLVTAADGTTALETVEPSASAGGDDTAEIVPFAPVAARSARRSRRPTGVRVAWMVAAAAVLALAAILAPWLRPDPYTPLLKQLPTYQDDIRFRSAVEALEDANLSAGLDAYAAGDYMQAVQLLRRVDTGGPFAVIRDLYLGSALAWHGDYGAAVEVLEPSADGTLPDPWGSEARWTLYVAYLGLGSETRADSLLTVLAGEPGTVGDRARDRREFLQRQ